MTSESNLMETQEDKRSIHDPVSVVPPTTVPNASFCSSVSNLMNTIIGAGVLAMPYALVSTGLFGGLFIIFLSGATGALGLYFLSLCAFKLERGKASFNTLSYMTFPYMAVIFDFSIAVNCFGVSLSYLILIGDVMPQIVRMISSSLPETSILLNRRFWISIITLIILPFMFLHRLDSLRFISVLSVGSIAYMLLIVIVYFFKRNVWNSDVEAYFFKGKGANAFFSSISIFIFAFSCQQNIFTIVNEIRDNSHKSILRVIITSIGLSAIIYTVFSVLGYLTFGINVPENIILGYDFSIYTTIGRIAIIIMITFTYPLQAYPCRVSLNKLISWRPRSKVVCTKPEAEMSNIRFYFITLFIVFGSYGLSMVVESFERVLAYVGTIGSTTISFILPGLYYVRLAYLEDVLFKKSDEVDVNEHTLGRKIDKKTRYLRIVAILLTIYGIIVLIISLSTNIIRSIKKS